MNKYTITEEENFVEYLLKMVSFKENNVFTGNYKEWYATVFGINLSRDESRKRYYGIKDFSISCENLNLSKIDNQEAEKRLTQLKESLFIERVKVQDANREKNKFLREQSRMETLLDELAFQFSQVPKIKFDKKNISYKGKVEASLLISDLHYGANIDNIVNKYNTEECVTRLGILKDKTISLCKTHKVECLHVELLGDLITGIIHGSTIAESNRDVISQVLEVSEILATFIKELNEEIPNVVVYSTFGNHARTFQNKSSATNRENFERLISQFIKLRLPNVSVHDSGCEDFIVTTIAGKNIVMTHGDKDNLNNAAANYTKLVKEQIDEIHLGHFHSHREYDDVGTQVVVNGSIMGTDDYAMSLRKNTPAIQLLRIYDANTCCYRLEVSK